MAVAQLIWRNSIVTVKLMPLLPSFCTFFLHAIWRSHRYGCCLIFLCGALAFACMYARGQELLQAPAALVQYPDLIIHNAKIVSMDDPEANTSVGRVYQA